MTYPLIIGGSAGSFKILKSIIAALDPGLSFPIIVCLHRLRSSKQGFDIALKGTSSIPILEVREKEQILPGHIYVAAANYHLIFSDRNTLTQNSAPPVHYSRPSIDITMKSAALHCGGKLISTLLSGANCDGAEGMKHIKESGGITIVQDPANAEIPAMPECAIKTFTPDYILSAEKIITFIENLSGNR